MIVELEGVLIAVNRVDVVVGVTLIVGEIVDVGVVILDTEEVVANRVVLIDDVALETIAAPWVVFVIGVEFVVADAVIGGEVAVVVVCLTTVVAIEFTVPVDVARVEVVE